MSLIVPEYKHIEQEVMENRNPDHIINCSSGVNDKLRIFKDRHTGGNGEVENGGVAFYIEEGNGDVSANVFVNQETLPELILLLQSMREERK